MSFGSLGDPEALDGSKSITALAFIIAPPQIAAVLFAKCQSPSAAIRRRPLRLVRGGKLQYVSFSALTSPLRSLNPRILFMKAAGSLCAGVDRSGSGGAARRPVPSVDRTERGCACPA